MSDLQIRYKGILLFDNSAIMQILETFAKEIHNLTQTWEEQ